MNFVCQSVVFAIVSAALAGGAVSANAKCTVTLKLKNTNSGTITVLGDESQSRVNGLTWSKMNFSNTVIQAGQTRDVPWTTNFSCGGSAKRDLRFKYQQSGSNNIYEEMKDNVDIEDGLSYSVTLNH